MQFSKRKNPNSCGRNECEYNRSRKLILTYFLDNKTEHLIYNIPKDTQSTVNGSCGNVNDTNDQFILIHWLDKDALNTLNMTFKLNHTKNEFSLNKIVFNLDKAIFPNGTNRTSYAYYHVGSFFGTPKHNAYHCTRPQILNLTNSENSTDVIGTVSFSHTLLEAYHEGKNSQFSTSIDCDAINTPGTHQIFSIRTLPKTKKYIHH